MERGMAGDHKGPPNHSPLYLSPGQDSLAPTDCGQTGGWLRIEDSLGRGLYTFIVSYGTIVQVRRGLSQPRKNSFNAGTRTSSAGPWS